MRHSCIQARCTYLHAEIVLVSRKFNDVHLETSIVRDLVVIVISAFRYVFLARPPKYLLGRTPSPFLRRGRGVYTWIGQRFFMHWIALLDVCQVALTLFLEGNLLFEVVLVGEP